MDERWQPYVIEVVTDPVAADGSEETLALKLAAALRALLWQPGDLKFLRPIGKHRYRFRMEHTAPRAEAAFEWFARSLAEAARKADVEGVTIRRIEVYPPEDEDEVREEWFRVAEDVQIENAEMDRADIDRKDLPHR